jgi:iron complex transport system substrate-binding protein
MFAGLASLLAAPARAAGHRIAVIDWGMLETLLALGVVPKAATELIQFRRIVIEPSVPSTVVDLGLRGSPNLELLQTIQPDSIVISNFYEAKRRLLERIAPVVSFPVFRPGTSPFALAVAAARGLGERFERVDAADRLIVHTAKMLDTAKHELAGWGGRPVYVVSLGDARHVQAFGADSMFGDVLQRVGLTNAWSGATRYSAAAPVGIEALAAAPDAAIVIVAPVPVDWAASQTSNAIWRALPAVRAGRVAVIEPVNHFGGLASAQRFARLFTHAISTMRAANHA